MGLSGLWLKLTNSLRVWISLFSPYVTEPQQTYSSNAGAYFRDTVIRFLLKLLRISLFILVFSRPLLARDLSTICIMQRKKEEIEAILRKLRRGRVQL